LLSKMREIVKSGRSAASHSVVIAGLDPAIHPFRKDDGCPGQARA